MRHRLPTQGLVAGVPAGLTTGYTGPFFVVEVLILGAVVTAWGRNGAGSALQPHLPTGSPASLCSLPYLPASTSLLPPLTLHQLLKLLFGPTTLPILPLSSWVTCPSVPGSRNVESCLLTRCLPSQLFKRRHEFRERLLCCGKACSCIILISKCFSMIPFIEVNVLKWLS